jgi:hypothetical protein
MNFYLCCKCRCVIDRVMPKKVHVDGDPCGYRRYICDDCYKSVDVPAPFCSVVIAAMTLNYSVPTITLF